jgi:NDP-sugar pyrophosphorylase family protein
MIVGYQKQQIFDYIGDGSRFGVKVQYLTQEKQLGTAHALTMAKQYTQEEFMVLAGNKLIMPDTIAQILTLPSPSILITKVNNPSRYGVVNFKAGKIVNIIEKPATSESNYISTGIYTFKKKAFEYFENELNVPDAINQMLLKGESIEVIETDKTWLDIVYPWDILSLNSLILERIQSNQNGIIEPGVSLKDQVSIGKDTTIHSNTYIIGPAAIGNGCEIGPNVCILPSTSIGDNVTIGPFTEIKNSVVQDDVEIGSHSIIQGSVIDQGCSMGSHFIACCDETEVKVDNEYYSINMGMIMGKSCRAGNMVSVQAGGIIGNYCKICSMKLVHGEIPDRSLII